MTIFFKNFLKPIFVCLFIFNFCLSNVLAEYEENTNISLQRLDDKKIEDKRNFFKGLFLKKKNFRKNFVITSTTLAVFVAGFLGYQYFKSENKVADKGADSKSIDNLENLFLEKRESFRKIWAREGVKGLCKYGFFQGISDGFYWGVSAAIVSLFVTIQTKVFDVTTNKFWNLWNGEDQERFLLIQKHLDINLELFKSFFDESNGEFVCYKREIVDNYVVFLDALETFIALTLEKIDDFSCKQQHVTESLISGLNFLYFKINDFSQKMEIRLNTNSGEFFDSKQASAIWQDFRLLNNQIIRYFNLCYSVFYENQAIS